MIDKGIGRSGRIWGMKPKRVKLPKVIVKTKWFQVNGLKVEYPNGEKMEWEYLNEEVDAVCGAVVDDEGYVYLVKEWRGAWQEEVLGVVTGGMPRGLSVEEAAEEFVREVREEVGFRPKKVVFLGKFKHGMSMNGYRWIFLGMDLVKDPLPKDKGEELEVVKMKLDETIEKYVYKGEGRLTSYSALALILARMYAKQREKECERC